MRTRMQDEVSNEKTLIMTGIVVVLVVIIGVVSYIQHMNPVWTTQEILKKAAYDCRKNHLESGILSTIDAWGFELVHVRVDEEKFISYEVSSAGRDNLIDTIEDNLSYTNVDHNVSRIVGEAVGKSAKEALVGVVDGIKTSSKFEESEEKSKEGITGRFKRWVTRDPKPETETKTE